MQLMGLECFCAESCVLLADWGSGLDLIKILIDSGILGVDRFAFCLKLDPLGRRFNVYVCVFLQAELQLQCLLWSNL